MEQLKLIFLGDFLAYRDNRALTFHSHKVRALLAYLVLESNRPHRREKLATLLWGDYSDQSALTNLRNTLSHLRHSLSGEHELPVRLVVTRATVQLTLVEHPQITVDVLEFDKLIQQCAEHGHSAPAHCYLCLTRLTRAVELYQGSFLGGSGNDISAGFDEWRLYQQHRHHQQAITALRTLIDHYSTIHHYTQVQRYGQKLLVLEPWNEEAHRLMMLSLAKRGDTHAALAHYDVCRRILLNELGIEPSLETEKLVENIRQGILSPDTPTRTYNMPATLTPFTGYETELAQVIEYLWNPECRLVTVLGTGGAGKTRFCLEAAYQIAHFTGFSDGVCFLPLAALKEPESLVQVICDQIGIRTSGRGVRQEQLFNNLKERRILFVFDQIEHLLYYGGYKGRQRDASAFIQTLLESAPGVKCLIASLVPLYIRAEWRYTLRGLAYPLTPVKSDDSLRRYSAIDLFWRTAIRINPTLMLTLPDWSAVVDICQTVQGLPLALEMAATMLDQYDCQQIADGVKQNLDFLMTPMQDVPDHHRSIRAVCDMAWQLLLPLEQHVLTQIARLSASFTLDDMTGVVEKITLDELNQMATRLVDKAWLYQNKPDFFHWHTIFQRFVIDKIHS